MIIGRLSRRVLWIVSCSVIQLVSSKSQTENAGLYPSHFTAAHVKIDFHPNYLPAKSDYFYRKQVVTKPETHKELGGKGRFYKPYIADVPEE